MGSALTLFPFAHVRLSEGYIWEYDCLCESLNCRVVGWCTIVGMFCSLPSSPFQIEPPCNSVLAQKKKKKKLAGMMFLPAWMNGMNEDAANQMKSVILSRSFGGHK